MFNVKVKIQETINILSRKVRLGIVCKITRILKVMRQINNLHYQINE